MATTMWRAQKMIGRENLCIAAYTQVKSGIVRGRMEDAGGVESGRMSRGCVGSCFFFQAEDGIRDLTVTGVQTCALPIYQHLDVPGALTVTTGTILLVFGLTNAAGLGFASEWTFVPLVSSALALGAFLFIEIGRASCRERV